MKSIFRTVVAWFRREIPLLPWQAAAIIEAMFPVVGPRIVDAIINALEYTRWSFRELGLDFLRVFASTFPLTYLRLHSYVHPEGLVSEYCTGDQIFTLHAVGRGKTRHYIVRERRLA